MYQIGLTYLSCLVFYNSNYGYRSTDRNLSICFYVGITQLDINENFRCNYCYVSETM